MSKHESHESEHDRTRSAKLTERLGRAVAAVSPPGGRHRHKMEHVPKKLRHTLLNVLEVLEYGVDRELLARKAARIVVCAVTGARAWDMQGVPWDGEPVQRVMKELLDESYKPASSHRSAWESEKERAVALAIPLEQAVRDAPELEPPPEEEEELPATPAPGDPDDPGDIEFYC